jgi:hypothetical protein
VFSTLSRTELKTASDFRAYVYCRCELNQKKDGSRQKFNVVFSECLRDFEKPATTKTLADFALCCLLLTSSIDSWLVVLLCCEAGQPFCATGCLTFWSFVASPFFSRFSPY